MKRQAIVGLAVVLLGCDRKQDDHGGIALEAAPQEIARAVCPKAYVCCTTVQLEGNDLAGKNEPECEVKTAEGFRKNLDGLKESIKKKRAVYRGDRMEACLAHIRSASCEQLNRTNHFTGIGCEPWVEPLVAEGGTCATDAECIEGHCQKQPMAWEGVCRPLPRAGEPCLENRCAKGFVCLGEPKTCAAALPEGAACTADAQCTTGSCSAPFGGDKACNPPRADKCFYASACSYGQGGAPASAGLGVMALLAIVLRRRAIRARAR
jgi:MYXO-CTERM domain-containing protein